MKKVHAPRKQTSIRVEAELLRRARYYLDKEGKNIGAYLSEQLRDYVKRCENGDRMSESEQ